MLTFEQMMIRLVAAIVLGAILGVERELIGKEAGIRTEMLVSGGAALFTMAALSLPYIVATSPESINSIIAGGGFFGTIASIVAGIGFLGAGLIIKTDGHPHGITTAALVWTTAAVGVLAGIGLVSFAAAATILLAVLLYVLRNIDIGKQRRAGKDGV
ncbi:MAG: MgtC/SapB family protein [Minisyncoccia bacterium]